MAQDAGHIYLCSTEGSAVEPPPGGQMDYAGLACVSDPADPGGRRGSFGELAETVVCSSASSVLELDGARAAVDIAETQIDDVTQIGSGWPKQVDFEFMPGADDDDEEEKEIYEGARLQHLAAQDKVRHALDEPPRLKSARLHRDGLSRRMCAAYGCALLVLAACVVVFLFWFSATDDDDDDGGGSIVSGSGLLDANATLLVAFSSTPAVVTASGSGCAVAYAVGESAVTLTGDAAGDTAYLCQPGDEVSYALVP